MTAVFLELIPVWELNSTAWTLQQHWHDITVILQKKDLTAAPQSQEPGAHCVYSVYMQSKHPIAFWFLVIGFFRRRVDWIIWCPLICITNHSRDSRITCRFLPEKPILADMYPPHSNISHPFYICACGNNVLQMGVTWDPKVPLCIQGDRHFFFAKYKRQRVACSASILVPALAQKTRLSAPQCSWATEKLGVLKVPRGLEVKSLHLDQGFPWLASLYLSVPSYLTFEAI